MFVYGLWTPGFGGSCDIHNMEMAHLRRQPSLPRLAGARDRCSFPGLCSNPHVSVTTVAAPWRVFGVLMANASWCHILRGA